MNTKRADRTQMIAGTLHKNSVASSEARRVGTPSPKYALFWRRAALSPLSFGQPIASTLFAALAIVSTLAADVRAAATCVGDCNADGSVTINELIVGVNMALGTAPPTQCASFDTDLTGTVTVNELIVAVNAALNGCTPNTSGVLLQGPADMPAVDATVDMPPVAVDESEIQGGVIMTRLDLHLAPGATVGQVNAALELVDGGVVSMLRGHPTLTIVIPRPTDLNALANVVDTLRAAPGISWTAIAHVADPKKLPPSPAGDNLSQLQPLLPTRFPAAWNASHLATTGCAGRKVTVLVADSFQRPPLIGPYAQFFDEIPINSFTLFGDPAFTTHGYDVTTTLAALFDAANPTGANPFTDCLQINAIQIGGLTEFQKWDRITLSFPAGKFLLNYSQGYSDMLSQTRIDACTATACTVMQVEKEIVLPVTRAYGGADWIVLTSSRRDDFLDFVAAGNERNAPGTAIYPGLGVAVFDSGMSIATLLPDDGFLADGFSWNATLPFPGFPKLTAGSADIGAFHLYMQALGVDTAGPADNVLMVGSTTAGRTFDVLVESAYSDSSPDLFAVGEQVFELDGLLQNGGTSLATPQVTGLASYLWLLSPDLRSRPASATREAIVANVRGVGVIDAYASALSLDAAALPTAANAPVRLAILDVNDDGRFDEADLDAFLDKLFTGDEQQDYSRFDLNGDGFTGGSTGERFDLDRVGSTQFGATQHSTVMQSIEGGTVSFDENQLTDLDILCYYAYSGLYTGDANVRKQLTAGRCGIITVTVDPAAATVAPGGSQQFAATVRGSADPRVSWQVVSGGGTISATGLFTAGQSAGTSTVRAISVADPNAFGEATVTVGAGPMTMRGPHFIGACASADIRAFPSRVTNTDVTFSVAGPGHARLPATRIQGGMLVGVVADAGSSGTLTVTATSVENNTIVGCLTLQIDGFVAAYGGPGLDSAFIARGADAGLPDTDYRVSVVLPGPPLNEAWTGPIGGTFSATNPSTGDSLSATISSTIQGTVTTRFATFNFKADKACAPP